MSTITSPTLTIEDFLVESAVSLPQVVYVVGDATDPSSASNRADQLRDGAKVDVIAHVVNNVGAWGAGFSGALTSRFGAFARDTYLRSQQSRRYWRGNTEVIERGAELGAVSVNLVPWQDRNPLRLYLVHLFAQDGLPSRTNRRPFRLDALQICVQRLAESDFIAHKPRFHMPRIGTGYGGGKWSDIEHVVNKLAEVAPVYVYDLPHSAL